MQFGLLGVLQVLNDQGFEKTVSAAKQRVLLAALLLDANREVSREALIDVLWDGEPPPNATAALRTYVARLRRALGQEAAARILARPSGLAIELRSRSELDATAAEDLCRRGTEAARGARWSEAAALLRRAESLWRGHALADVPSDTLRRGELPRLEELRLSVIERRIDAELHLGRANDLIGDLRALVDAYPLRENTHAQLMLALYRSQRRGEALAAFRDARRVLREQLGTDPTARLQELHRRVLAADPALDLVPQAQTVIAPPPLGRPPRPTPGTAPATLGHDEPKPSPAPAWPTPYELPPAAAGFTGRDPELGQLNRLLASRNAHPAHVMIGAITGPAGVGKSALAVHWARSTRALRPDPFPDGCLYVDLRGYDPGPALEPRAALGAMLRSIGVAEHELPHAPTDRAARLRSLLDRRRMLLLLDNARDAEHVRDLIPGEPSCLVLVTSRDDLSGLVVRHAAGTVDLGPLSSRHAVIMLRNLLGDARVDADTEAALRVAESCERLPLALRIAAATTTTSSAHSVTELARRLADEDERLNALSIGRDPRTRLRSVLSWSTRHLPETAARMFRLVSYAPTPDFDVHTAADLCGVALPEAAARLDALVRAHLLEDDGEGHYRLHGLLRTYAREQSPPEGPEHTPAPVDVAVQGTVVIGSFEAMTALPSVQNVLKQFQRSQPQAIAEIRTLDFVGQTRALRDGEVEAAFCYLPVPTGIEALALAHDQRVLCIAAHHPLAARSTVQLDDLAELPIIGQAAQVPAVWRDFWMAVPRPDGSPVRILPNHVTNFETILSAVTLGQGVCLAPAAARRLYPRPGIAYLDIDGLPPCTPALAWPAEHRDAPAVIALREAARAALPEINSL